MSQCKEFQGKTLDDAIQEACAYYGVPRAQLEIEIVSDAKTGIFGLVGVKKACIRASRVELTDTVSALLSAPVSQDSSAPAGKKRQQGTGRQTEGKNQPGQGKGKQAGARGGTGKDGAARASAGQAAGSGPSGKERHDDEGPAEACGVRAEAASASQGAERERKSAGRARKGEKGQERAKPDRRSGRNAGEPGEPPAVQEEAREELLPEFNLADCDTNELFGIVREVVLRLVEPIVGQVPSTEEISGQRIRISLDCGDAAGLLVGREGQTLASVQYLATRIVSRRLGGAVRLQIDAGNYRERQDDKLKELALALAAKVKENGKPQSTRPLSAYQRRIIHLALEADAAVVTRSKGEGVQRRVTVYLRKDRPQQPGKAEDAQGDGAAAPSVSGEALTERAPGAHEDE